MNPNPPRREPGPAESGVDLLETLAVRVHDEQASLFEQRYRQLERDPYWDPFTYSRKKIAEVCAAWKSGQSCGQ